MGGDDESGLPEETNPSRARRAQLLSALSLVAVAVACVLYLRPTLQASPPAPALPHTTSAQLDAVDFVSPTTGWVLEDLDDFQFAVIGTTDAGRHWTPELVEPTVLHGEYMRFFDAEHGVVSTVGGEPLVYTTDDGGIHWTRHIAYDAFTFAISASFTDPLHGWELIGAGQDVPITSPALVRTTDGGKTWTRLGVTVPTAAQPFAVAFSDARHGWLDTVGPSPLSYATDDGGATWHSVAFPAPPGGWPVPNGSFFVAVRPMPNGGVVASVVNSARVSGRASGIDVLGYPPLTVRTFDGGAAVIYAYSTFADSPNSAVATENRPGQPQAANQTVLRSTDGGATWTVVAPPSNGGTMGFAGPLDWWWMGASAMSTTMDGGVTWSAMTAGGPAQPIPGSLVLLDSQHAWVGGTVGGSTLLYTTSNAGSRWSALSLPSLNL